MYLCGVNGFSQDDGTMLHTVFLCRTLGAVALELAIVIKYQNVSWMHKNFGSFFDLAVILGDSGVNKIVFLPGAIIQPRAVGHWVA